MPNSDTVLSVIAIDPIRVGGAEVWFRELSEQLDRRGWKSVLCFLSQPTPQVAQFLKGPNITLGTLKDSWKLHVRPAMEFAGLVRKYRPRIVHLHHTGFITFLPWMARLNGVEKVFFTDHGSQPEGYVVRAAPVWKRVAVRMINYPVTTVFCVSDYGLRCNRGLRLLPPARYQMIYNGIDVSRAALGLVQAESFRLERGIPLQRNVILQVSWLIGEKGIEDLLRAAQTVIAAQANAHFVIVGEGNGRVEFEKLSADLGIADHVTWTGLVDDPLGHGGFAAAEIVCQMSRWEEVFGQVIAEAMASSKPVVATRVGGIPELVDDGKTGFVVERRNPSQMSEKILQLLRDADLRRRLGERGKQVAQEKFEVKKNIARLIQSYRISP